jgi:hypothetical protein
MSRACSTYNKWNENRNFKNEESSLLGCAHAGSLADFFLSCTLKMEVIIPQKYRSTQYLHSATSQKTAFLIVPPWKTQILHKNFSLKTREKKKILWTNGRRKKRNITCRCALNKYDVKAQTGNIWFRICPNGEPLYTSKM